MSSSLLCFVNIMLVNSLDFFMPQNFNFFYSNGNFNIVLFFLNYHQRMPCSRTKRRSSVYLQCWNYWKCLPCWNKGHVRLQVWLQIVGPCHFDLHRRWALGWQFRLVPTNSLLQFAPGQSRLLPTFTRRALQCRHPCNTGLHPRHETIQPNNYQMRSHRQLGTARHLCTRFVKL